MTSRSLGRRLSRLEARLCVGEKARPEGVELVLLPDDLPSGCEDAEAFVAARRARAGGKLLLVLRFIDKPGEAACP